MNVKQIIMVTYKAIIHNIPFQVNTSTLISEVHVLNNNSGMTITTIIGNRITVISFGIQSQLYTACTLIQLYMKDHIPFLHIGGCY